MTDELSSAGQAQTGETAIDAVARGVMALKHRRKHTQQRKQTKLSAILADFVSILLLTNRVEWQGVSRQHRILQTP